MAQSTTSKPSKKSKPPEKRKIRRVNWKALAILGGGLVVCLGLSLPARYFNAQRIRSSALFQAKESQEKGDVELAIRHLDRYLADRPDDIPVLQARADLVVSDLRSGEQLLDAANTLERLIRIDPYSKDRDATRRKLAEFLVLYSDFIKAQFRMFGENGADPDSERKLYRYTAAVSIANQLIDKAKERISPEYDLRLVKDLKEIPEAGKKQIIVADVDKVLHFRVFDENGNLVVETDGNSLKGQEPAIEALRKKLEGLWPPHKLTESETSQLKALIVSIVDYQGDTYRLLAMASEGQDSEVRDRPANLRDSKELLGFDLRLMSPVKRIKDIPTEGKRQIIVADVDKVLHFRVFDEKGNLVVKTDEKELRGQERPIRDFRKELEGLWSTRRLTDDQRNQVITDLSSIVIPKSAIELAIENYKEAIRINPRDILASQRLANLYLTRLKDRASREGPRQFARGREQVRRGPARTPRILRQGE